MQTHVPADIGGGPPPKDRPVHEGLPRRFTGTRLCTIPRPQCQRFCRRRGTDTRPASPIRSATNSKQPGPDVI